MRFLNTFTATGTPCNGVRVVRRSDGWRDLYADHDFPGTKATSVRDGVYVYNRLRSSWPIINHEFSWLCGAWIGPSGWFHFENNSDFLRSDLTLKPPRRAHAAWSCFVRIRLFKPSLGGVLLWQHFFNESEIKKSVSFRRGKKANGKIWFLLKKTYYSWYTGYLNWR